MIKSRLFLQRNFSQEGRIIFKLECIRINNGEGYMISLISWGKHVFEAVCNNRPKTLSMPKHYFIRLQNIDRLIRMKGTGSPKQLAERLHISESLLYEYLSFMKEQGAPIAYCKNRKSYYYEIQGGFNLRFINNA